MNENYREAEGHVYPFSDPATHIYSSPPVPATGFAPVSSEVDGERIETVSEPCAHFVLECSKHTSD